jgi:hypothetical protein
MAAGQDQLRELCERASEAAEARGHELDAWTAPSGEESVARATSCRRCGRVVYVRAESGFLGAAGEALMQPCPGSPGDGSA